PVIPALLRARQNNSGKNGGINRSQKSEVRSQNNESRRFWLLTSGFWLLANRGHFMKPTLLLLAIVLLTVTAQSAAITDPVRIESGLISGTTGTSSDVRVYKGIPFAQPPVGSLRWRAPQPVTHWDGVRKADQFGPRCT